MGADPAACGYDESDGPTTTADGNAGSGSPDHSVTTGPDPKRTFSVTRRAAEFLDARAADGAPFYLQVSYYALHRPVEAREGTMREYEEGDAPPRTFTRGFAAMTEDLDEAVGALLERVADPALRDRTWVILTSDNGGTEFDRSNPLYSEHGETAALGTGLRGALGQARREPPDAGESPRLPSNHPLRGSKQRVYEGGIRVPFLVAGPGVAAGTVCRAPVTLADLLPTLVDLAGGGAPPEAVLDGASLRAPLESGGAAGVPRADPALIFHRPELGFSAVREGDRKLIVAWAGAGEAPALELYDVVADPGETRDLSDGMPEETRAMFARLVGKLEAMDAVIPPHAAPGGG
jgi:arylsulfatase A-like enzyme